MGHTNSTANLSLPQFIGTDKPTWLGDINSAFSDIDAYAGTNDAAVSGAVSDAASAVSQAASAVSTANAANTTAGNASTAATNAVGTANNAMSLVNQTNIKIGTLANLNTNDKTSIVNAINELVIVNVGSSSSSGTNADKLAEIEAVFTGLSDEQKLRAKIKHGNGVFSIFGIGGYFNRVDADMTNVKIEVLSLTAHTFYSNLNGTGTDLSSTTDSTVFELYA